MMRRAILAAVLLCQAVTLSAQRVRSDQEILIQLERDWDKAFHSNDVAFVDGILAEEFVATYENGSRADRKRELELVRSFNQQIDDSSLDDFTIRTYRDTAVVMFTLQLLGPMKGQQVQLNYRYIDVWIFRDGKWQCVASQSTRITAPDA